MYDLVTFMKQIGLSK